MSLTFTVRYTDVAQFIAYKRFAEFNNELVTWDMGPAGNNGQALRSADGATWNQLFGVTAANVGNCNTEDGNGIAVYNNNLFISLYRSDTVSPKVIEYKSSGGSVTNHLVNPAEDNYGGFDLVVWNRELWLITDVTPFVNDRRVVYRYDGLSWTAIRDYDGPLYLDYAIAGAPTIRARHRTSRLFVFNGELYFIASRYTGAVWAWEVWKFDADAYDNFTLIYDSGVLADGYVLSGILENDGTVYIIGNTLAGANPQNAGKLYSSTDMENWTAEATYANLGFCYGEKLYDGSIYLNCLDVGTNRTQIKHIDDDLAGFTQDQEITTNTNNRGGGMESFLGDLYVGKYKEIWGAPAPAYKQTRLKGRSCVAIEMTSVDKLGVETVRRYAPMDIRAPTRFYHGMLKGVSTVQRSIDDHTGLFRMADMSAVIDNSTMEFSKILASTEYFKNQIAKLYHFWADEPERLRQHIMSFIIEDHSIKGTEFKVKFKDIALKYFEKKIPTNICTSEIFANIHPDYEGSPMPEILGEATLTVGENLGAVKAIPTSTVAFTYLASAGTLNSVPEVYSDNVLMATPADYSIFVVLGRTYIVFLADQGDKTISFNAQGYSLGEWDSANGYIQNPAYIMLYFLRYILEVPLEMIDVESFDDLAAIYVNMGVEESGKLIIQRRDDSMEILRQLLFSFGAKGFMALGGKFKVGRKDISNYSSDMFLSDQNDALDQSENKQNLTKAMNVSKDRFDYIPWLRLFKSASEASRDTYPEDIEDDIEMPTKDQPEEV